MKTFGGCALSLTSSIKEHLNGRVNGFTTRSFTTYMVKAWLPSALPW